MKVKLQEDLISALFGNPLVGNIFRGTLVEAILAQVLEPDWRWCSSDWASHDFETADGVRLEVKQSAALQSWHRLGDSPSRGKFDIASRSGRYEGALWIDKPGRTAQIYVFAWHPITNRHVADHREPDQWQFYAVNSSDLPEQKTIALSRVAALAVPRSIDRIAAEIRRLLG